MSWCSRVIPPGCTRPRGGRWRSPSSRRSASSSTTGAGGFPPSRARESLPGMAMRVALIHDWLTGMRGGERCLEVFCEIFPEADLFTLLHVPGSVSPVIERRRVVTSFLQHVPGVERRYRHLLPLMPAAV